VITRYLLPFRYGERLEGRTEWHDGSTTQTSCYVEPCQGPGCPAKSADGTPPDWIPIIVQSGGVILGQPNGQPVDAHGTWFRFCSPGCLALWADQVEAMEPVA
jgi:hypothetical protein